MLNNFAKFIEIIATLGAGLASLCGSYQPKTPKCLLEDEKSNLY